MDRSSRLLRFATGVLPLALASAVACDGGHKDSPSDVLAAPTSGDLPVPANTILLDAPGENVLPPEGSGALNVGDRGEAHERIPMWVPPGRAGMQPELALAYSSTGGDGLTGTGWALAGLSRITRCKALRKNGQIAPPILWNFGDSYCLDGEPLVPDSDHVIYKKFHDDGSLIVHLSAFTDSNGTTYPEHFRLLAKSGRTLIFGLTPDSRVTVSHRLPAPQTMSYALSHVHDRTGNLMTISYVPGQGGDIVPHEIDYTGSASDRTTRRSVTFVYDTVRPDVSQRAFADQYFTYAERLVRLEMRAPNSAGLDPLRTLSLGYTTSATTGRSLLSNIAECDGPAPSSIPVTGSTPLCRQASFTYAPGVPISATNSLGVYTEDSTGATISDVSPLDKDGVGPNIHLLDVDGDGRDDLLYMSTDPNEFYYLRMSTGTAFGPPINTGIPIAIPGHVTQLVVGPSAPIVLDFDGDGHADILVNQGPSSAPVAHLYLANNVPGHWTLGGFGYEGKLWSAYTNYQSADLNGDGRADLIMMLGPVAYYSINTNGLFSGLTQPAIVPDQTKTNYEQLTTNYFLDLNNDGVTEIMTRFWADDACVTNKADTTCNCKKMGYGALDVGAHLFAGYTDTTPLTNTFVPGLKVCAGIGEAITPYTPLFGDFNGDGVVDVIQMHVPISDDGTEPPMNLDLALGGGDQTFAAQGGASFTLSGNVAFQTMDGDLDGKTDLLVRGTGLFPYTLYSWRTTHWQATPIPIVEEPGFYAATQQLFASGDVNGDGLPDLVAYIGQGNDPIGRIALYTRNPLGTRADLLTGVTGDFGPTTTVKYAPYTAANNQPEDRSDCQIPLVCVTRGGWLVSEIDVDNGVGGTNAVHHAFASGRLDAMGWGFLGYKTHTITEDATGAVTTRKFDLSVNTSGATPFYPFLGLPVEVDSTVTYQSGGQPVTRTSASTTSYTVRGTGPFMALPTTSESSVNDSNFSGAIAATSTQRSFDDFGNQTFEKVIWPLDSEEHVTNTTYLNDTSRWIIGRPTYVSVTSTVNATITGGVSVTRDTAYTYDDRGQLAAQIDNPGPPNNGSYDPLPPQSDGVQTLYTKYTRDANGLPTRVEKLDNLTAPTVSQVTLTKYDTTEGMYAVETTDPVGLVTRSAYEPGLGVLAAQTDAAGVLSTYQYDTFGRIRADHPAAGGDRSVTYHGRAGANFGSTEDHRLGQYDVTSTLDSLRRTVATTKTGRADGQAVSTETIYDALGRVHATTRPHFAGANAVQTVTTYDNLGRVTQVNGADGSTQTTALLGRQITTTNPDGNLSRVTNDSLGRPITSVQALTTGPGGLSGPVTTTTLTYGPFDVLQMSTDTSGNVVRTTYDRLGRPHIKQDRDSRATGYIYDVFGELTSVRRGCGLVTVVFNGKVSVILTGGEETVTTYDGDGRVLTRTAPDGALTNTWDTVYPGKIANESLVDGTSIDYTYDTFGNLKSKKWNGPRGAIGYSFTYDKYNRLSTTTYPPLPAATGLPALVVQNDYSGGDVGGELVTVRDVTDPASPRTYWKLRSTDASETFSVVDLRHGVQTTTAEDPAHPGWLKTITSKIGTTTAQALDYTREGSGRVHERDDTLSGTKETFGYDGLERLTSWTWNGAAGARGVQYVYDAIGNLQQRQVTAGPGTNVTYTYGGIGYGPHQVSMDSAGATYAYDPRGNQTGAGGRTVTFDSLDLMKSVTAPSGTYATTYDAERARFSRTDPAGNVRYSYGKSFDEFTDAAGTHYLMTIPAAGHVVAQIEKTVQNNVLQSTKSNTILVDALGSIDALVGSDGAARAVKYDPFGARVQASDPFVHVTTPPRNLRAGFTGHLHDDDVNLIDMIGRVYDPAQQRFLSVDPPAPNPTDGQAWNPYAYVRSNPLNATDPTGYYELLLDGMSMGANGEDLYGSAGYFDSVDKDTWVTVVIPYGTQPGEVQGVSGTDGPGNKGGKDIPDDWVTGEGWKSKIGLRADVDLGPSSNKVPSPAKPAGPTQGIGEELMGDLFKHSGLSMALRPPMMPGVVILVGTTDPPKNLAMAVGVKYLDDVARSAGIRPSIITFADLEKDSFFAKLVLSQASQLIILTHGAPGALGWGPYGEWPHGVSGDFYAGALSKSGYNGAPMTLFGCDGGSTDLYGRNAAQSLANRFQTSVLAWVGGPVTALGASWTSDPMVVSPGPR